jgi:hypothetical protein
MEAEEGIDYRDPGGEKFASARLAVEGPTRRHETARTSSPPSATPRGRVAASTRRVVIDRGADLENFPPGHFRSRI